MEAVKAMIVILLVGVAVFAVVVYYNSKTEPAYEAKIIQANMAGAADVMKQAALGETPKIPGATALRKNKNSKL